jgi:hypothetical protein
MSLIDLWELDTVHFAGLRNSCNLARDEFVPTAAPFPRPPGIFSPFTNTIELIRFVLYERFGIVEPTATEWWRCSPCPAQLFTAVIRHWK